MINVLNVNKVSQIKDFAEIKFEFELDSASALPVKTYLLGNKTCLIANDSLAKNISTNTYYRYNNGKWFKILGADVPSIIKNTSFTENGEYNVINDNYKGYNNINVNVSAPTSTIIEKSITANGVYNALDDSADGYNPINVNVPNTYTAEDEGKVVNNGTLIVQTAYPTEITENDTYDTTNYNSITVNVSGGGGGGFSGSDVIFYDYDGTVVASYSAADFANLSAMPDNPTHTGLTAQGWNWTLADAKTYVASYSKLNIGQMYITSDGKTRLYYVIPKDNLTLDLRLTLDEDTELDVDWGDNTEHTMWTSNDDDSSSKSHEYSDGGRYTVAITVISGGFSCDSSGSEDYTLKKVEFGSSVTSIGDSAFRKCQALSSITIPDGVTSIGYSAFESCYGLSSITIPNGVTSIRIYAFGGCYALTSITIPSSVTSIESSAFSSCYGLSSVIIPSNVTSIGDSAFYYCYGLTSITIPNSVTSIGYQAFYYCSALTSITIPSSVTSIESSAFYYCYGLSSVIIPSSVISIGNEAFGGCSALSSITIPNGVTSIEDSAFEECYGLSSVIIPSSVISIGSGTFQNCFALSSIIFEPTTPPTLDGDLGLPTTCIIKVPQGTLSDYTSASNYPDPSTYIYMKNTNI